MCLKMLKSKTVIPFRIVAVILTLLCVCMCFWQSVGVSAYYRDDLDGDWGYDILDDGTLQVDYYAGDDDTVVIPATISGRRVKSVAEFTTAGVPSKIILSEGIKMLGENGICASSEDFCEIILPNSLTYIGDAGLSDCYIKQINIPDSVTYIGKAAFSGCKYLEHIELPDSVTEIGLGAFDVCLELRSIKFPKNITNIPDQCASTCNSLDNVVIPEKVTSIGEWAFAFDWALHTVTIPLSVVKMGEEPFYSCDSLSTVYYEGSPEDFQKIQMDSSTRLKLTPLVVYGKSSEESSSYPIDEPSANTDPEAENYDYEVNSDGFIRINKYKKNEENVLIPSTIQGTPVSEISSYAFADCTGIKSVTLPDYLKTISFSAFENCTALDEIVLSDTISSIKRDAFKNTGWYNKQNEGILTLESASGKKFIVGVKGNIPENTKLEIERGASYIAEDAFSGQTGIVEVTIPDTVEIIGSGAFMFCSNLKKVVIKAPITEIESSTFSSCESLESITIPSTVTSIGKWAFSQSNNLKEINYTGTEEQFKKIMIKDETFYGATYDIGVNYNYVIPEPEPDESSTEPEKSETLVVSQQSVSDESKIESSITEKSNMLSESATPESSVSENVSTSNNSNNTGLIITIIIISVLFAATIALLVIVIIKMKKKNA